MSPESDLMENKITSTGSFVNTSPIPPAFRREKVIDQCSKQILYALDSDKSLRGYVEDKVRPDYNSRRSRLTIRMPNPLYNLFCAGISDEAFGDFARKIKHLSISRIRLPNDTNNREQTYSERCLDALFIHEHAKYPGVIIEVCYSQKVRAAADLADEYILDTNASVNAVIALNIEYKGSKKATISVWRPHKITVDRVKELEAKAVIEMILSLRDLAPKSIAQKYLDLDQDILISSRELCDFLSSAEAEHQKQLLVEGVDEPLPPGTRKRRGAQTPSPRFSSDTSRVLICDLEGRWGNRLAPEVSREPVLHAGWTEKSDIHDLGYLIKAWYTETYP
ncbi:hypothetical protein N7530_011500 [Penicillium desertorum]|uniref:Uncharacterized protein n=1 Tax=Penicillium desertorum TaxID=1303715 RepID=A0A9W9WDK0_9EURO|nr:hypothetical protein N7530_011500 [Penicillium desertorum]